MIRLRPETKERPRLGNRLYNALPFPLKCDRKLGFPDEKRECDHRDKNRFPTDKEGMCRGPCRSIPMT